MKIKVNLLSLLTILLLFSCTGTQNTPKSDDNKISFTILQTNDVYEIAPLEGGNAGGMARIGQLKKDLLKENPNTISVMSGDFLNPSVIGTLKYENERIKGKQMVETMNVAGLDLVTFGNHEFDLNEEDLLKRIEESEFNWAVANVFHVTGEKKAPFTHRGVPIPSHYIKTFKDADGTTIKLGIIGVCLDSNQPDYVSFTEIIPAVRKVYNEIKNEVDLVFALTHQSIDEDLKLAAAMPNIPLIIGGHEHNNMKHKVGKVSVTKADANAKSAYIHRIKYNKKTKKLRIKSKLKEVDETIPFDSETDAIVQKWNKIAYDVLKDAGIDPDETITTLKEPIDATEDVVREGPSVITTLTVNAVAAAAPDAQGAIINTGSIRLDDILSGKITQYDVVRLLPFGGEIVEVDMKGALLLKILEAGIVTNVGNGGYLALSNITYKAKSKKGTIGGAAIEADKTYKIATLAFLMLGLESNLGFLTRENEDVVAVTDPTEGLKMDIRLAVIDYMKKNPIPIVK